MPQDNIRQEKVDNSVALSFFNALTILILGGLIVYFAVTRTDKFLKIKAVSDCNMTSRYQVKENEKTTVYHPLPYKYNECMKDMGYITNSK